MRAPVAANEMLSGGDALEGADREGLFGRHLKAAHLRCIEHREAARGAADTVIMLVFGIGVDLKGLVKDNRLAF